MTFQDSRFMLSQPTTTTTKSPPSNRDRPIRRVSTWDRKHEGGGGFGFEYGLDGNDDPEYDGGFGNQLVRALLSSLFYEPLTNMKQHGNIFCCW